MRAFGSARFLDVGCLPGLPRNLLSARTRAQQFARLFDQGPHTGTYAPARFNQASRALEATINTGPDGSNFGRRGVRRIVVGGHEKLPRRGLGFRAGAELAQEQDLVRSALLSHAREDGNDAAPVMHDIDVARTVFQAYLRDSLGLSGPAQVGAETKWNGTHRTHQLWGTGSKCDSLAEVAQTPPLNRCQAEPRGGLGGLVRQLTMSNSHLLTDR